MKLQGFNQLNAGLNELGSKHALRAASGALNDAVKPILKRSRASINTKTGVARKSIKSRPSSKSGKPTVKFGSFGKKAFYVKFLNDGTKKHTIPNKTVGRGRSKRKNNARVKINGKVYRSVTHPGIKGSNFLMKAIETEQKQVFRILGARLRERIILQAFKKSRGI